MSFQRDVQINFSAFKRNFGLEFNATDTGHFTIKRYYISQRVKYNWDDAFISCKSAGMRMATIENKAERENLKRLATNFPALFKSGFFIDGINVTGSSDDNDKTCLSVKKPPYDKFQISSVGCNYDSAKFMCEDVEVVDNYKESHEEVSDKVNVLKTFFSYLGDYGKGVIKMPTLGHLMIILTKFYQLHIMSKKVIISALN